MRLDKADWVGLRPYAKTEAQKLSLEAMIEHMNQEKAAKSIGRDQSTLSLNLKKIKNAAALQGYAPEYDLATPVPETHYVKGVSSYYSRDKETNAFQVAGQWIKTDIKAKQMSERFEQWVASLSSNVEGMAKPVQVAQKGSHDQLAVYVMGDPHIGALAWHEETGEDYDLKKAVELHRQGVAELVDSAPTSREALLVNLGDYYHADNEDAKTRSGHVLDVDTRHAKVFRAGCDLFMDMIAQTLTKHEKVTVYITRGNHDRQSSFAMAEVLRAYYRNEPRVEIVGGVRMREYHRFGNVFLGITHGDTAKPAMLAQIMSAERAKDWGETTCRRWLVGHYHHQHKNEYPGCVLEIFPTLAGKDAWHSAQGYNSERAMTCLVYHREHGEMGRRIVGVPQLSAA